MSKQRFLPTPEEMMLNKGLYEKVELGEETREIADEILELELFNGAIRTYCPDCEQESTFRANQIRDGSILSFSTLHCAHKYVPVHTNPSGFGLAASYKLAKNIKSSWGNDYIFYAFKNKAFTIELYCTHNHNHRIFYTFNIKDKVLQKIGQFPSIADSMEAELKVYKKELEKDLGKEKAHELSKAVGLFSHGVGIGSFVYLRRIFEAFIYQAKDEALAKGDIDEEEFKKSRMDEKIELLKEYLPEVLVEHKSLYGVLSKGIHELSEKECKEYFDVVKEGIELILDEKIVQRKAQEKKEKFGKSLSKVKQELSK